MSGNSKIERFTDVRCHEDRLDAPLLAQARMKRDLQEASQKLIDASNCCASSMESVDITFELDEYGRQGLIDLVREFCSHAAELRKDARELQRQLDLDWFADYQAKRAQEKQSTPGAAA